MTTALLVLGSLYLTLELAAAVYILKNRAKVLGRLRATLSHVLRTQELLDAQQEVASQVKKTRFAVKKMTAQKTS